MTHDFLGIPRIVDTEDGSRTVEFPMDISYRSRFGAHGESRHVFMEGSQIAKQPSPWHVLEIGIGTGMNLANLLVEAEKTGSQLRYIGIERNPLPLALLKQLELPHRAPLRLFEEMEKNTREAHLEYSSSELIFLKDNWLNIPAQPEWADVIFFDPFGPAVNPEAWTARSFLLAEAWLKPGGALVTYGAAGHVRRAMREARLTPEKRDGYAKKREMTVATKEGPSIPITLNGAEP